MYKGNKYKNIRGSLEWFREDLLFEDYPLSDKEEKEIYQEFRRLKTSGKIPYGSEYHDWKVTAGYPKQYHNYFSGSNWYLKPSKWMWDNCLMVLLYKAQYKKEWQGEDIAPCDNEK